MQIGHFIKAFIKNPLGVSTIFPASDALAYHMAIQSEVAKHKTIVEIGVGTGALTKAMIHQMGRDHSYTGFEIDKTFFKYLEGKFSEQHKSEIQKLKKFEFKKESAEKISQFFEEGSVDVVVSSLPWSVFEPELQQKILQEIHKILKPDGIFSFYNYITASQFRFFKNFKSEIQKEFKSLEPKKRVWASFPPTTVWIAKK